MAPSAQFRSAGLSMRGAIYSLAVYTNVGLTSVRQISLHRPQTSQPASQLTYTDTEGSESFALSGGTNPGIFIAPVKGGYFTLRSPTGVIEIQYTFTSRYVTSSIAAYPAESIGAW